MRGRTLLFLGFVAVCGLIHECASHHVTFQRNIDELTVCKRMAERRNTRSIVRRDGGDIELSGGMMDAQYFMDIEIGNQKFVMSMDTGSSFMAVATRGCEFQTSEGQSACISKDSPYKTDSPDYMLPTCSKLGCSVTCDPNNVTQWSCDKDVGADYCIGVLAYGDGTIAAGPVAQDRVEIVTTQGDTLTSATQQFIMIKVEQVSGLSGKESDGIIGLAYPTLSYNVSTLVDNIITQNSLENRFSMCMGDADGMIVWGSLDATLYTGEIEYIPIIQETYYVIVTPTNVTVNDYAQIDTSSIVNTIVDSGTTYIVAPTAFVNSMVAALNATCLEANPPFFCSNSDFLLGTLSGVICGITREQVEATPRISFNWIDATVFIRGDSYIRLERVGSQVCGMFGIAGSDDLDGMMILGDTFMKNFYTVFDRAGQRVGFAKAVNCGKTIWEIDSDSSSSNPWAGSHLVIIILASVGGLFLLSVGVGACVIITMRSRHHHHGYGPLN